MLDLQHLLSRLAAPNQCPSIPSPGCRSHTSGISPLTCQYMMLHLASFWLPPYLDSLHEQKTLSKMRINDTYMNSLDVYKHPLCVKHAKMQSLSLRRTVTANIHPWKELKGLSLTAPTAYSVLGFLLPTRLSFCSLVSSSSLSLYERYLQVFMQQTASNTQQEYCGYS